MIECTERRECERKRKETSPSSADWDAGACGSVISSDQFSKKKKYNKKEIRSRRIGARNGEMKQ